MPPSPLMRCSPRRELSVESNHKRGCNFDIGSRVKAGDDDLALFDDMQMQERDNFLLHSTDDFEDSLSQMKYFSDFKLNIPPRGASSDLLNVESEKNDYDWLLTPPDTPLFPSLDDDDPMPGNLVSGSRPPTQPITISRSSMTEKNHRTSRRSESPRRLSPSPRSGSSMPQSGGRPFYAHHSSPTSVSQPTPSQRPASPPSKPSTSTPRSSTPTLQRMSSGSSGNMSSSARKGASPVKASRGNSASPKLRGWPSDLPGFSLDTPPNLRTSLSDHTASHSRGSSPAYRSKGDSPLRNGRQSLSPTASRSVSSCHGQDRDHFSSHSKDSIASYGDDDVESLHSVNAGISGSTTLRRNRVIANNKNTMLSKKPSRTLSASSAPKRSLDSIIKQDQHKSPQNMFRPLLSSVPTSTLYVGKANSMHRPTFSRNSSVTTSSNASSELGASVVLDTEGSEHDQNDVAGEWEKMLDADVREEIFTFDKTNEIMDIANEVNAGKPQNIHGNFDGGKEQTMEYEELKQLTSGLVDTTVIPMPEFSYDATDHQHCSEVDFIAIVAICFKCNKRFQIFEATNGNVDVCQECAEKDEYTSYRMYPAALSEMAPHTLPNPYLHPAMDAVVDESGEKFQIGINVHEAYQMLVEETNSQSFAGECQNSPEKDCDCLPDICPVNVVTSEMERGLLAKLETQPEIASTSYDRDASGGAGISVLLLKRSNSGKGPIVQGRSLTTASVFCAEPSYTRDNMNALKFRVTRGSSSASSSVDLGSSRQSKVCMQQQLRSSKADRDVDCVRSESGFSCQSTETCVPRTSSNLYEDLTYTKFLYMGDNLNSQKGRVTWESSSASSIDLDTSRQTEAGIQSQSSCSKDDTGCARIDPSLETQSTQMFPSGVSCKSQDDVFPTHVNGSEEKVSGSAEVLLRGARGESSLVTEEHEHCLENIESCDAHSSDRTFLPVGDEIVHSESCKISDSSLLLVSESQNTLLENVFASDALNDECCASSVYSEAQLSQHSSNAQEDMVAKMSDSCPFEEDELINGSASRTSISESVLQSSSCATAILLDDHDGLEGPQTEGEASESMSNIVESSNGHSVSPILEENVPISSLESNNIDHSHEIHGDSAITVEGPGGNKPRCLTLEEATDTILFCSSIIHGLAFKAASIGMEREYSSPEEAYRPTPVTMRKSACNEKDQNRTALRRATKPPKSRKMLEVDANAPIAKPENNCKITKLPASYPELPDKAGTVKPLKLESKCNCTVM